MLTHRTVLLLFGLYLVLFTALRELDTYSSPASLKKMNEQEIENLLKDITFLLYDKKHDAPGPEDFRCSAFTVALGPNNVEDLLLSTGHCRGAEYYRDRSGTWSTWEPISYFLYSKQFSAIDFVIGTRPTEGTMYSKYPPRIASGLPQMGETCYTLGLDTPTGKRGLATLRYDGEEDWYMKFELTKGYPITEGVSGSPIVNQYGETVGIEAAINTVSGSLILDKDHKVVGVKATIDDKNPSIVHGTATPAFTPFLNILKKLAVRPPTVAK